MIDIWCAPRDITFTRDQMIFLIQNLDLLREGIYPPECKETGYISLGGRKNKSHAPFETAAMLAAEVDSRLEKTGIDGELLIAQIKAELPLHPNAVLALRFIGGWRRKRMDYLSWCRQVRHRQKGYENIIINSKLDKLDKYVIINN